MIIRYFKQAVLEEMTIPVWEEVQSLETLDKGKVLTREEAQKIINERGYKLVHVCNHGQIFDTPDEPFKKLYKGIVS